VKTILHLGLHKTGSTFLQNSVFPKLNDYKLITRPHTQYLRFFNELQYADDVTFFRKYDRNYTKKFFTNNTIISDEAFLGKPVGLSSNMRYQIIDRLAKVFPDATVIVTIRNQWDTIRSHYNQYLKQPFGTRLPNLFFANINEGLCLEHLSSEFNKDWRLKYDMNSYRYCLDQLDYFELYVALQKRFSDVTLLLYEDLFHDPLYFEQELTKCLSTSVKIQNSIIINKSNNVHANWARRKSNILTAGLGRGVWREVSFRSFYIIASLLNRQLVCDPESVIGPDTELFFRQKNSELRKIFPRLEVYSDDYRVGLC